MASDTSFFLVAAGALAIALRRRKATPALYTCGDGCNCTTSESRRAPVTPIRSGPKKVELAPGASVWLCTCGER